MVMHIHFTLRLNFCMVVSWRPGRFSWRIDQAQAKKVARQLNRMLNELRSGDEDTQPTREEVESQIMLGAQ